VLEHAPARYNFPPEHLPVFRAFLEGFSAWMVNTNDDEAESNNDSNDLALYSS
jgi:hypothetical protein